MLLAKVSDQSPDLLYHCAQKYLLLNELPNHTELPIIYIGIGGIRVLAKTQITFGCIEVSPGLEFTQMIFACFG